MHSIFSMAYVAKKSPLPNRLPTTGGRLTTRVAWLARKGSPETIQTPVWVECAFIDLPEHDCACLCWGFGLDLNLGVHLMPVLQGYLPSEYICDRLKEGMWVGIGSVCKRAVTRDHA